MKLTIKMDLDNAAFSDNGPSEVRGAILRALDRAVYRKNQTEIRTISDTNGNRVGTLIVED